ncbi:GNAT family N-acetyltransferase [Celerinatantimonas yamalensis]|uniref:GNAT family N-acetyltransferase n=1 Tax=Celerinatantimonas yamalensis TaxID=559956 RepID=A0ABW9G3T6_9GAMM
MDIHFLTKDSDYSAVLDVLLQLRTGYDMETLSAQVDKQLSSGYQVVYVKSPEGVLAVAGFTVSEKLAWGKSIYIDDLITHSAHRSRGVGQFIMNWFKNYAVQIDCDQIHLDSGVQRFAAHRFYLRAGFNIASHHFSMVGLKNS